MIATAKKKTKPAKRHTYRHGDLRRALLEAGIALAQAGGPDAVVLREATRRAGVVPNAAYRHFASRLELLHAVRTVALSRLALSMEAELGSLAPVSQSARARESGEPGSQPGTQVALDSSPGLTRGLRGNERRVSTESETTPPKWTERTLAELARASLRAVGTGYLRFALSETGLFRTIFAVPYDWPAPPDPAKAGSTGLNPFQLLGVALDRMIEAGLLPKERRPGAEFLAWSAVHGIAMLIIDGPLRNLPRQQTDALAQRVIDMVEKGL